jgi:hypothetical protein
MTVCCDNIVLGRFFKAKGFDAYSIFLCCLFSDAVSISGYTVRNFWPYLGGVSDDYYHLECDIV